ncbi:MAG: hypothetical protein Q9170_002954 [Blastenia crenularia]
MSHPNTVIRSNRVGSSAVTLESAVPVAIPADPEQESTATDVANAARIAATAGTCASSEYRHLDIKAGLLFDSRSGEKSTDGRVDERPWRGDAIDCQTQTFHRDGMALDCRPYDQDHVRNEDPVLTDFEWGLYVDRRESGSCD